MSKKFIVAAVVAMIAFGATFAMATESRRETLGNQGLYLKDDTCIFANPATMSAYRNMIRLHMGGIDDIIESDVATEEASYTADMHAYGGGTIGLTDALTLGVFVGRNPSYEMGGISKIRGKAVDLGAGEFLDPFAISALANGAVDWMNPLDIIVSYKMGDLAVGLSYYLANGKTEDEYNLSGVTYEANAKLHSLKFSALYKTGNMKPITMWAHWDPYSIVGKYTDSVNSYETSLSGNKIVLGTKVFYSLSDSVTVVPAVKWENTSGEVEWDDVIPASTLASVDFKMNSLITGMSVQYKADNLFLISSLSLKWSKAETTSDADVTATDLAETVDTSKAFSCPVAAIGIEYQAKKWLMLRSGINTTTVWASKTTESTETDSLGALTTDESTLETVQETTAAIGVGLLFGNLTVDATLGNMFLAGEDGASEAGNGPNLFSHLDVKYMF